MKVIVTVSVPAGTYDEHEAYWIDVDEMPTGSLDVQLVDEDRKVVGHKYYARGYWHAYEFTEMPTDRIIKDAYRSHQENGD